ncbi:MAG TPA: Asp23/Gls24 family envelope stress response protein [Firmicutes bacterium]|nr:Asp23/Gls24 family envelope stress response protein [Bacillota bacterium]
MADEAEVEEVGSVRIADEVVATIAGSAAAQVDGVVGMTGGLVGDIGEMLGKKNFSRGVKVEVGEKEAAIDVHIIVEYGARIPEVAQNVQENVKKAVEIMTGLKVIEVNVHVNGVAFKQAVNEAKKPV